MIGTDNVILRSKEWYSKKCVGEIDGEAKILLYFTDKIVLRLPFGEPIWYQQKKPKGIAKRLFGGSEITHELVTENRIDKIHLINSTHDSEGLILTFRR